jgi:hypothetical protein
MRKHRRWWWGLAVVLLVVSVAQLPARRAVGVNTVVTDETLPLWVKVVNFVDRDLNFDRLADSVIPADASDAVRTLAAFEWTRAHVRPKPPELPSIDDHVWHIVVRGYGQADQQADVFTTLLVYDGIPAYWTLIGTAPTELPVSYVRIEGAWRVFDVAHGIVFRRGDGTLATPQDVAASLDLVQQNAAGQVSDLDRYLTYFRGYRVPEPPDVLRADLQMPSRRVLHELRAVVGMQGRVWSIRPHATQGATQ